MYEYKFNVKLIWKLFNDFINRKKSKCKLFFYFKFNEEEIFNFIYIVNCFCEYFINIGFDLVKLILVFDKFYCFFLDGSFINLFFF